MALIPFFSMVDRRKSLHLEVIEDTRADFPGLLATEVPYWSEIERMTVRRAPLPAYAPRSAAGQIYESLWKEVATKLGQAPFLRAIRATAAEGAGPAFAHDPSDGFCCEDVQDSVSFISNWHLKLVAPHSRDWALLPGFARRNKRELPARPESALGR